MSAHPHYPPPPQQTATTSSTHQESLDEKEARWRTDPVLKSIFMRPQRPELYPLTAWESCLNPVTAFYNNVIDRNLSAYTLYQNVEYARHTSSRLFPPNVLAEMSRVMRTKLQEVDFLDRQWVNVLQKTAAFFQNSPMSNYTILPPFVVISEQEQFNIAAYYAYLDYGQAANRPVYRFGQSGDTQNRGEVLNNTLKRKWSTEDVNEPKKKRMNFHNNNNTFSHTSNAAMK
nr:uncharacterized protein LOC111425392 [Onthophagus taurus]